MKFRLPIFRREATAANSASATDNEQNEGASLPSNIVSVHTMNAALRIPACYRAVTVIANTLSMMAVRYERIDDEHGGNFRPHMRGEGAHVNYLLQVRPNRMMIAADFWKRAAVNILCEGNAVVYIDRPGMSIRAFYLCQSASVDPQTMHYTVTYQTEHGLESRICSDEDVLHFKNDHVEQNGLYGIPTLRFAADALSLAATNDQRALMVAARGGDMKYILSEDRKSMQFGASRTLTQNQKNTQKSKLQEQCERGDQIILVSGQVDLKPLSDPGSTQILLEARKQDTLAIARVFGVPPTALMDYTNNTYKAPEQGVLELLNRTILPRKLAIENELNAKLVGETNFGRMRFHMDDSYLLQLDPKGRAEIAKLYVETGVWCPNEARLSNNLPALPEEEGGNRHFVSTNLRPLNSQEFSQATKPQE